MLHLLRLSELSAIKLPLKRVNLIVGDNNTGKTSALKALKQFVPDAIEMPVKMYTTGLEYINLIKHTVLKTPHSGVILWDNAHSHWTKQIRDDLFSWVLCQATETQIQIFMVTHDLEIIDSVATVCDIENLVLFHFSPTENALPQVKTVTGEMLKRLRFKRGIDVR